MQPLLISSLLNWVQGSTSSRVKVAVKFKTRCIAVEPVSGTVHFQSQGRPVESRAYDLVVGADGVRSAVRSAVALQPEVSCTMTPLKSRWKFLAVDRGEAYRGKGCFFNGLDGLVGGGWHMRTGKVRYSLCLFCVRPVTVTHAMSALFSSTS
jgi:hypothetical protein